MLARWYIKWYHKKFDGGYGPTSQKYEWSRYDGRVMIYWVVPQEIWRGLWDYIIEIWVAIFINKLLNPINSSHKKLKNVQVPVPGANQPGATHNS